MAIDMGVAYQPDRQELACCRTRWETLGCNIWKETILTVPVPSTIILQYMTVLLKKKLDSFK